MKTAFFTVSAAIVASLSFTSCDKINSYGNWEVDWSPVELMIKVQDAAGNDLLDPDNPANAIDGTTITFGGETYESSREWYETGNPYTKPQTKTYLARLYGLFLSQENKLLRNGSEDFILYFGEIDGAADMDEDLVITWPDKTTDTIHYHCSKHNERKLSCDRNWKLNGKSQDSATFIITK